MIIDTYRHSHYVRSIACWSLDIQYGSGAYKAAEYKRLADGKYSTGRTRNGGHGDGKGWGMGSHDIRDDLPLHRRKDYHALIGVDLIIPDEELTNFSIILAHQ